MVFEVEIFSLLWCCMILRLNDSTAELYCAAGVDVDLDTPREIGYAHAQVLSAYRLRTDFRTLGIEGVVNLMIERCVVMCMGMGELVEKLRVIKRL